MKIPSLLMLPEIAFPSGEGEWRNLLSERAEAAFHIIVDLENSMQVQSVKQIHNGRFRLCKLKRPVIVAGRFHYGKEATET